MIPDGLFPGVALAGGTGVLAVREGDSRAAGAVVVYAFDPSRYACDPSTPAVLTETWRHALPAGSPCFPNISLFDGMAWLAYHDGSRQQLRNLVNGIARDFDGLSNPTAFGGGWFAYTNPRAPYQVTQLNLRTGDIRLARLGAPTGLSRILADGTIRTIDEDRFALAGATIPSFAGPLTVGEGPIGGAAWRVEVPTPPDQKPPTYVYGTLWLPLDGFTPKAAADGDTLAITTAGSGSVRLFCGTRAQLIAASTLPAPPPIPPPTTPPEDFMDPWKVTVKSFDPSIVRGQDFKTRVALGNGVEVEFEKDAHDELHVAVFKDGVQQDRSGLARHVEVKG